MGHTSLTKRLNKIKIAIVCEEHGISGVLDIFYETKSAFCMNKRYKKEHTFYYENEHYKNSLCL